MIIVYGEMENWDGRNLAYSPEGTEENRGNPSKYSRCH
jgi:hypothetical protein